MGWSANGIHADTAQPPPPTTAHMPMPQGVNLKENSDGTEDFNEKLEVLKEELKEFMTEFKEEMMQMLDENLVLILAAVEKMTPCRCAHTLTEPMDLKPVVK